MIKTISNYSDEQLVYLIQQGNEDAANTLIRAYKRYCSSLATRFFYDHSLSGIPLEDMIETCTIAVIKAAKAFSNDMTSFYPYWKTVATNDLIRLNEKNSYFHHSRSFYGISLDDQREDDFSNDQLLGSNDPKLEIGLVERTIYEAIKNPKNGFSSNEKTVLLLHLDDYDVKEIAEKAGLNINQVYYLLKKGLKRLKKVLSK